MLVLIFTVISLLLSSISLFYALQLMLGIGATKLGKKEDKSGVDSSFTLIIPAHNEEAVISDTLLRLTSDRRKNDRILVVADNCSDNTAEIAKNCGVEVTTRLDLEKVGKGFALAHGLRFVEATKTDTIIILDADCKAILTGSNPSNACRKLSRFFKMVIQLSPA